MFNNNNAFQNNGTGPSTALTLQLSLSKNTTTLIGSFTDPDDEIYSTAQGNNQLLPNGNSLAYYGLEPVAKEFSDEGTALWSARFGPDNTIQSYRMFKYKWHSTPNNTSPALVVQGGMGYVSWNGATEVTKWAVYTGTTEAGLARKKTVAKRGFETSFAIGAKVKFVKVVAYSGMTALKESEVVAVA